MMIIWKILTKEIRKKPGRFIILTAGMTVAVCLITAITIFSSSCLHAMILQEKEENGPYESIFHNLTTKQVKALSDNSLIRQIRILDDCPEQHTETVSAEHVCCGVSFRHISLSIFKDSQKVGEEIGMEILPEEDRPLIYARTNHSILSLYDITFNNKLLGYYGINASETTAGSAWSILLVDFVIVLFAAALLYYISLSGLEEKLKITGFLDGIGLSEKQKAFFAFGENLLAGFAAIPAGILLGIAIVAFCVRILKDSFLPVEDMEIYINPILLIIVLAGTIVLVTASSQGLYDRIRKESVLDLISGYREDQEISRTAILLNARRHFFKAETLLAVKNVLMNHSNYCVSSVLLVIALCVLMNGTLYVEGLTAPPTVAGQSVPVVSLWASVATDDTRALEEAASCLEKIEGIDTVMIVREAEEYTPFAGMDITEIKNYLSVIRETNLIDYIQWYEDYGESIEDIMKDTHISKAVRFIGTDRRTFHKLMQTGSTESVPEEDGVILENSAWAQKNEEGLENLFPLFIQGEEIDLPVWNSISRQERLVLLPEQLITAEKQGESSLSFSLGTVILFVPLQTFDKYMAGFSKKPASMEIILTRDKNDRKDLKEVLYPDKAAERMTEDRKIMKEIKNELRGSELENLRFYSFAEEYRKSFFIGGKGTHILLITALVTTVWIAAVLITLQRDAACIRRRKKEFALLQSIGMQPGRIIKMIFLEHLTFAFSGIIMGIPLSIFILYGLYKDGGVPQMSSPFDIPAYLILIQIVLTAFIILIPFLYTVRELKQMDMIDIIRKEEA